MENETAMKPEDLKILREWSRELDSKDSRYRCVVSVLMLREGWDVRNVTTIVPLRPYSAKAGILPEQTLGRGLRRMDPLGDKPKTVVVIHHPAFRKLYEDELAQEGLDIAVLPVREVFKQTVTIFVDHQNKPVDNLDIEIPQLSNAITTKAHIENLTFEEIRDYFQQRFRPLPIGSKREEPIEYVERHLFTEETVARMQLNAGLLENAWSAPSYFAQMIGRVCGVSHAHQILTPLIERFIREVLFERTVNLYSGEVDRRMRDADVREHICATFLPIVRKKITQKQDRQQISKGQRISTWKPYQAASNDKRPAIPARRTIFNLVPCENEFEQVLVDFLEVAQDVVAFAKNAGPQRLMIDYIRPDGHRAFYMPDFFVRLANGKHYLMELKGREDTLVPFKARAAAEWCKTASQGDHPGEYLYVPYHLLQQSAPATVEELARACEPSLKSLLQEAETGQQELPLAEATAQQEAEAFLESILQEAGIHDIALFPTTLADTVCQAIRLLNHSARSRMPSHAHAFQPLLQPLDEYALRILDEYLTPHIPEDGQRRDAYFSPPLDALPPKERTLLERHGRYLKDNLVSGRSIMRLGTLLFCLKYAQEGGWGAPGVWQDVQQVFNTREFAELYQQLETVNQFRNTRVAHVEVVLDDAQEARSAMIDWLRCLSMMVSLHSVDSSLACGGG